MKRTTSQDYVRPIAPIAEAALARGGFERGPRGRWVHGARHFSFATIKALIDSGKAVRQGKRVVAVQGEPQ